MLALVRLVQAENLDWRLWRLRSEAHKAILEILSYIWAQFAFKLGHANFPTRINRLQTSY